MPDLQDIVAKNPDLVIYFMLLVLTFGIVNYWRAKNLEKLQRKLESADSPPSAEEEAAKARLSALSGIGEDQPPVPTGVQETPASGEAEAPAPAPAPAGGGGGGPSVASGEQAVLTQYTAGDGQGVEEIEKMLEKDPNNLQLLDWLAFMYYSNNDTEKAIETYARITSIDPSNASQHYYLANSYYKANRVDEALEHWRKVVELKPDGKLGRKANDRIKKVETALGG